MAFMDSAADNPEGMEGPDSSGTGPEAAGPPQPGMTPPEQGGPILAALQRSAQGPQVSAAGPGNMADALSKLKIAVDLMQSAIQGLPPGSQPYQDTLRALERLARHLPQEGAQTGQQQTILMDLLRRGKQNPMLQAIAGVFGGAGGGPQGQGAGPAPPMPSTPLPGA
jgi:hypothetical protein